MPMVPPGLVFWVLRIPLPQTKVAAQRSNTVLITTRPSSGRISPGASDTRMSPVSGGGSGRRGSVGEGEAVSDASLVQCTPPKLGGYRPPKVLCLAPCLQLSIYACMSVYSLVLLESLRGCVHGGMQKSDARQRHHGGSARVHRVSIKVSSPDLFSLHAHARALCWRACTYSACMAGSHVSTSSCVCRNCRHIG